LSLMMIIMPIITATIVVVLSLVVYKTLTREQ